MKRILLLFCICFFSSSIHAQDPMLFEVDSWTLHYVVFDGVQTDVPQPSPQDPQYDPGIFFLDTMGGTGEAGAFIYFNAFGTMLTFQGDSNFTTINPSITLGECEFYCEYEELYLEDFLFRDGLGHTFQYEIIDEGGGNKTLILTDGNGDIAVHGNYTLGIGDNEYSKLTLSPNPVEDRFEIFPKSLKVERVTIYHSDGRKIAELHSRNNAFDLPVIQQGLYFIEFTSNGNKAVKKLLKR